MSANFPEIDRRAVRRNFGRAAKSYRAASRLEEEIGARMLERLDYVRIAPRRILDAGSGPSRESAALLARYKTSDIVALDFSLEILRTMRKRIFRKNPSRVCAELERLPFGDGGFDLVWSNMSLHWLGEPAAALSEFSRVLAPEGLLMFSTLGPDSLKELRAAAGRERVHAFHDMHDIGDMLVASGFAAPVMDMELLTFTYASPAALLADLRASGQTSARADRPRGLAGKRFNARLRSALAARATFEVVYGHAWKGKPRARGKDVKTIDVFKRLP